MKSLITLGLLLSVQQSATLDPLLILEGRLSWSDAAVEFRACDKDEIYLVEAAFSIEDVLYRFIQSQSTVGASPIYVRFNGAVIENVDELPERYADVVRIINLLAYSTTVPATCR